jgi:hypothetical protein
MVTAVKDNYSVTKISQETDCEFVLRRQPPFIPVLIRDDTSFHLLMIFADSNGKPGAQFPIVQGIHDTEHLSFVKTKSVRRFLFIFKMGSNIERVSYI